MPFPALVEAEGKLADRQKKLHEIFDQAGSDLDMSKVTVITGDSKDKVKAIRDLNAELDDLGAEVESLRVVEAAAERSRKARERGETDPGGPGSGPDGEPGAAGNRPKDLGEAFLKSKAYSGRKARTEAHLDIDLKTLMTTSAGWAPETTRTGRVIEEQVRPIQVTDIIPSTTTTQAAVVYMEETTFTNNAAEVAEGGTYGEAALALTEQSSTVRKIGVFLPVTDEQLEDEPMARGYVNNRLPFMVRQRLDGQILTGDGSAPNLRGANNVVGIQTQAKGTDPVPDAVYKAMTKIKVTGRAMPSAVVFHPNDWQDVRLLRTSDGIYIWGSPSEAGPARIWGLQVVESDAQTENTALAADFLNYSELAVRRGIDVQVSNSHGTYFVEGKQAIRADLRAALIWYRPQAICTVTGI